MKYLITGGAGFIGSHLTEEYLQRGHDVYIIDDLSTGSLRNIQHFQELYEQKGQLFVSIDTVMNRDKMMELIGTCDVVIHLAAAVGVQYILDNPLSSMSTNVKGTELVLDLCDKFKKHVLIASTSEVYGKVQHAPLVETDDSIYGPSVKSRWSYAAGKLIDEFLALAYFRTNRLPITIVRLFNTVGPRQTGRYGMVLPRLVKQALNNETMTVYGDGSQTRTFTHVKDVVSALIQLSDAPQAIGEVVNIGGHEEVSILSLAQRIKSKTQSSSDIQLVSYHEVFPDEFEDIQRRVPSIEKLRRITGYSPALNLDQILDDVIAYVEKPSEISLALTH